MKNTEVLLLDDEPEIHHLFKRYFEGIYNITSAYSYDDAETIVNNFGYDKFCIYIVDIILKGEKSGLDFIEDYLDPCRTIVVSGYINRSVAEDLVSIGIFSSFKKPVDMASLFISMNSILRCEKNG
jgi:DNA-binding NtrC family response regulator